MLSEVVTCNCAQNPGGHAESDPRPSEEGVSFYHVLRPLWCINVAKKYTTSCSIAVAITWYYAEKEEQARCRPGINTNNHWRSKKTPVQEPLWRTR